MSVGVVILAKSSTPELAALTEQTITTLIASASQTVLDIIVLEQQPNQFWPCTQTIYCPEPFHFNQFANRGCRLVSGDHLLICNNDLIFGRDAVDRLHAHALQYQLPVVCPVCPHDDRQKDLVQPERGTQIGRHFSGWCFMIRRNIYEQIGGFDEDFAFWYADNAVVQQLQQQNFVIEVLPTALVTHLTSSTLKTLRRPERLQLTKQQATRFINKYGCTDH